MKQGLVRLLYNLGKVHGVDITHDNVCSSMLSCFYSHLLSTGRPISSLVLYLIYYFAGTMSAPQGGTQCARLTKKKNYKRASSRSIQCCECEQREDTM